MNRTYLIAATLASSFALCRVEASLIAGWDFSQFSQEAFDDIDESFEGRTSLYANYSDLGTLPFGLDSQAFGIATWDNPNAGNSDVTLAAWTPNLIASQGLRYPGGPNYSDRVLSFDSCPAGPTWGQIYQNHFKFGDAYGNPAVVVFKVTPGKAIQDWGVRFGANTWDGAAGSVMLSYSTDDGSTYSTPVVVNIDSTDAAFIEDFSAAGTSDKLWIKFDLSATATIDNVAVLGVEATSAPTSFWAASPADAAGWRFSGEGYPGERGIGWIWDPYWPWVYVLGVDTNSTGDWLWVYETGGSRTGFYAYNAGDGYWIYGNGRTGWYWPFDGSNTWQVFMQQ